MTAGAMSKLFCLDIGGRLVLPTYLISEAGIEGKKLPHHTSLGYRTLYQLKRILVAARARNYKIIKPETDGGSISQNNVMIDRLQLNRYIHRISELEKLIQKQARQHLEEVEALSLKNHNTATLLLSATAILDAPGVYFLCNGDEVVYVGMSRTSVLGRVNGRANLCDKAYMIETSKEDAPTIEQKFIRMLRPKGNIQHNQG